MVSETVLRLKPRMAGQPLRGEDRRTDLEEPHFLLPARRERHFFTQAVFSRLVPTAALRAGILEFKDASGNIIPYNLNAVRRLILARSRVTQTPARLFLVVDSIRASLRFFGSGRARR